MARFYIGQPIVSLWSRAYWAATGGGIYEAYGCAIPEKGVKYTVTEYCPDPGAEDYLHVAELNDSCQTWYKEIGFAPISEDQVKAIISTAIDVPDIVRKREQEPA